MTQFTFSRKIALIVCVLFPICLLAAPHTSLLSDTVYSFLPWGRASGGVSPGAIYAERADCNYPPLFLYFLTAIEQLRLRLGFAPTGAGAYILLKLPSIVAYVAGVLLCAYGLRKPFGEAAALRSALAYALCLPLFVNAALWGQVDALLCVFVIGGALSLLHRRPGLAGVCAGLALALKLQAIVAIPFLIIYSVRKLGRAKTLIALASGLCVWGAVALPFLLQGGVVASRMIASYTGAVGMFPIRSSGASNIWYLTVAFDRVVRRLPAEIASADNLPILGPLTAKMIGLLLFGAAMVFLLTVLRRRTTFVIVVQTLGLGYVAFFLLCTQQHERYILPGIAFLALCAGFPPTANRLYWGWSLATGLNQIIALIFFNRVLLGTEDTAPGHPFIRWGSLLLCFVHIGLAVASTRHLIALRGAAPDAEESEG